MECPKCKFENPDNFKSCSKCAYPLEDKTETRLIGTAAESERKSVTIMFCDLTGYTAMNERLDPEEIKEIMNRIFGEITQIIKKYDGFIERFIGDAVMAVFGVPKTHEDDPVRAIRAAVEILAAVEHMSPQFQEKIGCALTMHIGINTGLVVTGEINVEKGTHGLIGDAINLAARLEGIAKPGEIIVGPDTYHQTAKWFEFEILEPIQIKGKMDPVPIYRVIELLDQQLKILGRNGVQAELVGRETEMAVLIGAVENLKQREGSLVSITGHAGTGKSRLIKEFKDQLEDGGIQWYEGQAYAYTQNMAYYPLTSLLTNAFLIKEKDTPEQIKEKIENGMETLLWDKPEVKHYLGSLFSIGYAEIDKISPEFWRNQLYQSVQQILEAITSRGPTVILFEDLHWADEAFIELLHTLLEKINRPVLFLCVYRPSFNLFSNGEPESLNIPHRKIDLRDLPWDKTEKMLQSLLNSQLLPDELCYFIKQKVEGNPFYLEEVVNTLIETDILVFDNGNWQLAGSLDLKDIPASIQGVLTARLDRLEKQTKRILQEASVIGRTFFYKVLTRVTNLTLPVDGYLAGLESMDFIRAHSREPELEFIFKHALTQEVIYNGLLKKERRKIHERIGLVIEELFADRLPEFYETLAFHFTKGQSNQKAVDYLIKSGEKSLGRYAVKESHQYFIESFTLLTGKPELTNSDQELLIDTLIKWAYVFYYRGDFRGLVELFEQNKHIAHALKNRSKQGFFLAWLGMGLWIRENLSESEYNLKKALELGEASRDKRLIGYAACWLSMIYSDLGLFDKALAFADKSIEIAKQLDSDHYLYFKSLHAKSYAYWYKGLCVENIQIGQTLLKYGREHNNSRCMVMGHLSLSWAHSAAGNPSLALEAGKDAVKCSDDPFYTMIPNGMISLSYIQLGEFEKAAKCANETLEFHGKYGCEYHKTIALLILSGEMVAIGKMSSGIKQAEKILFRLEEIGKKGLLATGEHILGSIYCHIAEGEGNLSLSSLLKNAVFLLKTIPVANKKARQYLNRAVDIAEEIGANGIAGQAYLDMGRCCKTKKENKLARQYLSKAVQIFEETKAEGYLSQAHNELASLKKSNFT